MGIFSRFRGNRDNRVDPRPLAGALSESQLDELRETAREWIRSGFRDKLDLATELADFRDDFAVEPAVVLRAATGIVDEEWSIRLAEQREWSGDSDYSRITRAFD